MAQRATVGRVERSQTVVAGYGTVSMPEGMEKPEKLGKVRCDNKWTIAGATGARFTDAVCSS